MSKSQGQHDMAKRALAPDPDKRSSIPQVAVQALTALSLFFVIMTPVIYIMGRAYHEGMYNYLHLDQSMFPLDTAGMLTEGGVALTDGAASVSKGPAGWWQWLALVLLIVVGGLIWALFALLAKDLKRDPAPRKEEPTAAKKNGNHWLMTSVLPRMALLAIFGIGIYEVIASAALVFIGLTQPFSKLGYEKARTLADDDFKSVPVVSVQSPRGVGMFREIGCGPQFCALWKDKHASFVPVSQVMWGDAPTPNDRR